MNGWIPFGGAFSPAQCLVDSDGVVTMRGVIRDGGFPNLLVVPEPCRPEHPQVLTTVARNELSRVDIEPSGFLTWRAGTLGPWFSLDGLTWPAAP